MNALKQTRQTYEQIPVPQQLSARVQQRIAEQRGKNTRRKNREKRRFIGSFSAAAALAVLVFAVNLNTAFAQELSQVPVLGSLVRLVTFVSYTDQDDAAALGITVRIPSLTDISAAHSDLSDAINREIYDRCSAYAKEARERAVEYRQAFLDTGGTVEEWKEHDIQIVVDYQIRSQTDDTLSFVVLGTENWTSAYAEQFYYNLNRKTLQRITLEELLGKDYVNVANRSIRQQIAAQTAAGTGLFFDEKEGGFTTIAPDQNFYIAQDGNPVIVFDQYTIAAGAAGNVEFEIRPE